MHSLEVFSVLQYTYYPDCPQPALIYAKAEYEYVYAEDKDAKRGFSVLSLFFIND